MEGGDWRYEAASDFDDDNDDNDDGDCGGADDDDDDSENEDCGSGSDDDDGGGSSPPRVCVKLSCFGTLPNFSCLVKFLSPFRLKQPSTNNWQFDG